MKKKLYLLILAFVAISCSKEAGSNIASENVVSNESIIPFEELLILIHIKPSDSTYLVVQSIDSVNIFINNYHWAKPSSDTIETTNIKSHFTINNYDVTQEKLNYLVIAQQDTSAKEPDFTTAGEIARYLNNYYEVLPGEYVCFIKSLQITLNDHSIRTIYPYIYKKITIEENRRSTFVGEFEVKIDASQLN